MFSTEINKRETQLTTKKMNAGYAEDLQRRGEFYCCLPFLSLP